MTRVTKSIVWSAMFVAVLLAGVLISAPVQAGNGEPDTKISAPSVATFGTGNIKKFQFATETNEDSTASTVFVPVPSMSVTFTSKGAQPFLITYCDEPFAGAAGSLIQVVARVDGIDAAPGVTQLDGDADENGNGQWARDHCFQWIANNVPAGTHTVTIFWASFFGDTVFAHGRSLVVAYKK